MEMFVVRGGRSLQGTVTVSGAKNSALPILAATLAIPGETCLENVPELRDITSMLELLRQLGMDCQQAPGGSVRVVSAPGKEPPPVADYNLVRKMRASVCVLGPLLARRGEAVVSLPGGCNIGHRPIDLHLQGLSALGAQIEIQHGYVTARATRLRGSRISLAGPRGSTVTGTCNVLTAAVLAEGTTQIESAACEPEVVDLGNFLNACGARISGLGTSTLIIEGVPALEASPYRIIPDRIEAATWLIAAAMTGGSVTIENCEPACLESVLQPLRAAGASLQIAESAITVSAPERLRAVSVEAIPYPGFPTDLQAQWTACMCLAHGPCRVTDRVFPERFMHAAELLRMGADVTRQGDAVTINGVPRLSGANVMASDLRASAALVLAALAADGESTIRRIYHLDRGYERLDRKLQLLGADVQRVRDPDSPASSTIPQPHWQATAVIPGTNRTESPEHN